MQVLAIGPSMKALAVVLKALLQQAGLNERVAGGLGSYTLLNLVMAHVMSQACPPSLLLAYMPDSDRSASCCTSSILAQDKLTVW